MSDLISRADAIEAIDKLPTKDTPIKFYEVYRMAINDAEWTIDALPSADAVQVARCKDCKHYSVEGKTTQFGWCNALEMPTDEQRFCADGERRKP